MSAAEIDARLVHATAPHYSDGAPRTTPDRLIRLNDIRRLTEALSPRDYMRRRSTDARSGWLPEAMRAAPSAASGSGAVVR